MTSVARNIVEFETAIVVLGHQMSSDGIPDDIGLARLALAADEMRRNSLAVLVTSGWAYRSDTQLSLAEAMANSAARLHDMSSDKIVKLSDPRDTVGDAVFLARAVRSNCTIVVTSEYHRARAMRIFRFVLGGDSRLSVLGVGDQTGPETPASEAASLAAFEETFRGVAAGDLDAIYRRMMSDHPYYNGSRDAKLERRHD